MLAFCVTYFYLDGTYSLVTPVDWFNVYNCGVNLVYMIVALTAVVDFCLLMVIKGPRIKIIVNVIFTSLYFFVISIIYFSYKMTINQQDIDVFRIRGLQFILRKNWTDSQLIAKFNEVYDNVFSRFLVNGLDFINIPQYTDMDKLEILRKFYDSKMVTINTNLDRYLYEIFEEAFLGDSLEVKKQLFSISNIVSEHYVGILVGVALLAVGALAVYVYNTYPSSNVNIDPNSKEMLDLTNNAIHVPQNSISLDLSVVIPQNTRFDELLYHCRKTYEVNPAKILTTHEYKAFIKYVVQKFYALVQRGELREHNYWVNDGIVTRFESPGVYSNFLISVNSLLQKSVGNYSPTTIYDFMSASDRQLFRRCIISLLYNGKMAENGVALVRQQGDFSFWNLQFYYLLKADNLKVCEPDAIEAFLTKAGLRFKDMLGTFVA